MNILHNNDMANNSNSTSVSATYVLGGHYHCRPDWSWRAPHMPDYDIWLVLNGIGAIKAAENVYSISTGDCFVFPPGCSLTGSHDPEHPLEVIAVHFLPTDSEACPSLNLYRRLKSHDLLAALMGLAIEHDTDSDHEKSSYWITAALTYLEERDQELDHATPLGVYDEVIADLTAEIDASPQTDRSVTEMAARCHLSKDHFTKVFKRVTGTTPLDYVVRARISQAKHDLLNSSLNVGQIAESLGYTSVYFFSRQFKAKVGVSPRDFRRSFSG